jgi:hypothetical protein
MDETILNDREKALELRIASLEKSLKDSSEVEAERVKAAGLIGGGHAQLHTPSRSGNSFESKTLQVFGAKSLKDLLETNVASKRFGHVDLVHKQAVISIKEAFDTARFISQLFYDAPLDKGGRDEKSDRAAVIKNLLDTPYGRDVLAPMIKAFGTGVVGGGAEWIQTALSASFIEEFHLEKRVAMLFREMPMPTNPYKLTVQKDVTIARIAAEGVAMTGASIGTDNITFDATKLAEFYALPEELNEDSAPSILAMARSEVSEAQIRARETIILNGDDTGTHMDFDVTAADDARKLAKGLRKLSIANTANGGTVTFGSAVTAAKLDEMRTNMGKFGINVRDLVYILGSSTYHQAVNLEEVSTVEKFGPQATILNGALAAFRGIPIAISEYVREDVSATGVNTVGGPNTKGVIHLAHIGRFWVGMRRPIRVRVMPDAADQDRWLLASYSRIDFKSHAQSANEVSVVTGINITV